MHPVIHILFIRGCFGLCDFIFMMREHQVWTATVNVKMVTQAAGRHGWTFNMPARTSIAPRWSPRRFVFLGMFPQYKVKRMFLLNFNIDAFRGTSLHIFQFTTWKTAIFGKFFYFKIDIAICRWIGRTFIHQVANHVLHLVDIISCTRSFIWMQAAQVFGIFIHRLDKTIG